MILEFETAQLKRLSYQSHVSTIVLLSYICFSFSRPRGLWRRFQSIECPAILLTYTSKNVSLLYLEHCLKNPKVEINAIFILHIAHTLQIQLTSVDINNSCSLAIVSVGQLIQTKLMI